MRETTSYWNRFLWTQISQNDLSGELPDRSNFQRTDHEIESPCQAVFTLTGRSRLNTFNETLWSACMPQLFRGAGMRTSIQFTAVVLAITLATDFATIARADEISTLPVFRIQSESSEVDMIEGSTMLVEHSARILKVKDFDSEILTVRAVSAQSIEMFAIEPGFTTVTLVDDNGQHAKLDVLIRGDVRHLQSYLRRIFPDDSINVEKLGDNSVRLDGWVTRPENVNQIQEIAEEFYSGQVLNHMQAGGVQQIMLKCTVLEVQRSKLRRLGMNFALSRPDTFLTSTPGPITPVTQLFSLGASNGSVSVGNLENTSLTFGLTRPDSTFQGFVQAMQDEGIFRTHATPMLTVHNGRPANFLSGGETPIPVAGGLGTSGVQYREFGIQLSAVPFILGNGRVRLEVETKISDQDFSNVVVINGAPTTSFRTNSANTQVEMNFGEALVIAGLVSKRTFGTAQKIPFFGELPWIGAAFSRKQTTEAETELIILITPELVAPELPGRLPAPGPGQSTDTPVDTELYFHGLLEVPRYGAATALDGSPRLTAPRCTDPNCPSCRAGVQCAVARRTQGSVYSSPVQAEPLISPSNLPANGEIQQTDYSELIIPPAPTTDSPPANEAAPIPGLLLR